MEKVIKNLFVKVTKQLNLGNHLISFYQESNSQYLIYIKTVKPINKEIVHPTLSKYLFDLSTRDINISIEYLGSEFKFCFEFMNRDSKLDQDIKYLVTDLNEIIRSYYHSDHIISSSALELLELGEV